MKLLIPTLVFAACAVAASAIADETTTMVTGEVIRVGPGASIVVRSDEGDVSYVLDPDVTIPSGSLPGRTVTLRTVSTPSGTVLVKEVTTTELDAAGRVTSTTEVTKPYAGGSATTIRTTHPVVTGDVVRFTPGRNIVVRTADGEVSYVLSPELALPDDVRIGRTVDVSLEPGEDGATVVKRVTTTRLTRDGRVERATDITRRNPEGGTVSSSSVTYQGKVLAYTPGRSVTVVEPSGSQVTYTLDSSIAAPRIVAPGDEVIIHVAPDAVGPVSYRIVERDGKVEVIALP